MATQDARQTAAINYLKAIADLGVAKNREELKQLYRVTETTGTDALKFRNWTELAERYNKLHPGENKTSADMKRLIEDLRTEHFETYGFTNLPNYGRLVDETTSDGLSYIDILKDSQYYKENENEEPIVNTPTPDYDLSDESAREKLLNAYYRDAYDVNTQGTNANQMYNQLVANNQIAAVEAARIADLNAQQAAMQQAATVKQITDQVRNERMARLRAGMSEAQIANQDMQSLMTNINALNQQANEANLARLSAQSAYNTAQADAYNAWLQQANAMATVGSANAAADAGDAINVANRLGYYSEKDKKFNTNFGTTTGTGKV